MVNEARERVLRAAEELFSQRGYASVKLRDVGVRAGIHHSSLYHHVPGGKEALFVEVMERVFARHRAGLTEALQQAAPTVQAQLRAAADWLLSQPPMDLVRMEYADMPALSLASRERLSNAGYTSLLLPLAAALAEALKRGEIDHHNLDLIAGGLLGMIESLFAVSAEDLGATAEVDVQRARRGMAYDLIDVMLNGLRISPAQ